MLVINANRFRGSARNLYKDTPCLIGDMLELSSGVRK